MSDNQKERDNMKQRYIIYTLTDPRNNAVFYVGLTQNEKSRYAQHLYGKPKPRGFGLISDAMPKYEYIQAMRREGYKPIMMLIDDIATEWGPLAHDIEDLWVGIYTLRGCNLFNIVSRYSGNTIEELHASIARLKYLNTLTRDERWAQMDFNECLRFSCFDRNDPAPIESIPLSPEAEYARHLEAIELRNNIKLPY
jgi:hypothetical protein